MHAAARTLGLIAAVLAIIAAGLYVAVFNESAGLVVSLTLCVAVPLAVLLSD